MDTPVSRTEFTELKNKVEINERDIQYAKERGDRHKIAIEKLEDGSLVLPAAIKAAVEEGMAPVLKKVLAHDDVFNEMRLMKEREEKERALQAIADEKDRKKWFYRTLIGSVIGAIVGPAVTLLAYILINNA